MNEKEQIEMMRRCSNEIKGLRAQIQHLEPKAAAYDNLASIIGLLPRPPQGYSEDLAWMLDKRIREIEERLNAEKGRAENPSDQQ